MVMGAGSMLPPPFIRVDSDGHVIISEKQIDEIAQKVVEALEEKTKKEA